MRKYGNLYVEANVSLGLLNDYRSRATRIVRSRAGKSCMDAKARSIISYHNQAERGTVSSEPEVLVTILSFSLTYTSVDYES